MNDEHDADAPGPTPGPTPGPEQDAEIRALLAELGSGPDGEEMPPEVAARLEDTLALLVAERGREEMAADSTGGLTSAVAAARVDVASGAIVRSAGASIVCGCGGANWSPTTSSTLVGVAGTMSNEAVLAGA